MLLSKFLYILGKFYILNETLTYQFPSHVRAEGKHHRWGYDLLDRVSQAEPSNYEDGSGAVYTPSSVQSLLLSPKGGADKVYSLKYLGLWFDEKIIEPRGGWARVSVSY